MMILIVTVGILSGCSFEPNVKANTIFVQKDKTILAASIETFDKNYYNQNDLKKYVEQQVESFKQSHTTGNVKLKKITVKKQQAKLYMEYSDYKTYAAFNEATFFIGTVATAKKAGYDFGLNFYDAAQAKEAIDPSTEQVQDTQEESTQTSSTQMDDTQDVEYDEEAETEYETETQADVKDNKYKESEDIKDAQQLDETEAVSNTQQENLQSTQNSLSSTQADQQNDSKGSLAPVDTKKVLADDSLKVLILEENTNIELKGKILYVSSHVKVTGSHTATVTGEGEASTNVTPAYIIYQ